MCIERGDVGLDIMTSCFVATHYSSPFIGSVFLYCAALTIWMSLVYKLYKAKSDPEKPVNLWKIIGIFEFRLSLGFLVPTAKYAIYGYVVQSGHSQTSNDLFLISLFLIMSIVFIVPFWVFFAKQGMSPKDMLIRFLIISPLKIFGTVFSSLLLLLIIFIPLVVMPDLSVFVHTAYIGLFYIIPLYGFWRLRHKAPVKVTDVCLSSIMSMVVFAIPFFYLMIVPAG